MKNNKGALKYLVIALVLILVSMIGASLVQTSGGKVTVKDLRWETPSGYQMSALLFIPENATKKTPAPAIVTSHGWYNNREMQDLNFVELSRRGYVVMAIDMYGHGNSDAIPAEEWANRGTGMYDAVEQIAALPYVDRDNIGVTGHSNGARAANWSVLEDNKKSKEDQLISSVLLIANDAMYTNDSGEPLYYAMRNDEQEYANVYGTRDVGIIAAQYDEFFFRSVTDDGSITPPREYINTDYAQSFLNFGVDPKVEGEQRTVDTFYTKEIDGELVKRTIHTPNQIHPWNHFSPTVVGNTIDYFEETIGAPNKIDSSKQIWQYKVFFNFLGLIGFFVFIVSFTKVMLDTSLFQSLKASKEKVAGNVPKGVGKVWFWGGLIVSTIISGWSYLALYNWSVENLPNFLPQLPVFYIGVWSLVMGLVTLVILFLSYKLFNKGQGMDLRETGVVISLKTLGKTILLAILVAVAAFSLVFIADYFFKTDFRIWVLAIKAFTPDKLVLALKFLPFFLIFYVANSIAVNCFNYVAKENKEWMNTALLAVFNGLSAAIILAIQYTHFFITGDVYFTDVSSIVGIWLFPIVVIIPLAAIITRKIYRVTNNPYLGGIIYAIIVTVMMVTNTLTQF